MQQKPDLFFVRTVFEELAAAVAKMDAMWGADCRVVAKAVGKKLINYFT